ncbi:deoxyribonuclease V [uncultured Shewanella sp.]|uniref:deoxyribonuclease V n=1 Tax=uncultured Shewanella sp. TaxID=173975 RepID=UPI00262845EF|nr:deoxyribonuclease V [uncultured Shewanella sp.]
MQPVIPFTLPSSEEQAIALQNQLAHKIIKTDHPSSHDDACDINASNIDSCDNTNSIDIIAGVDVAYCNDSDVLFAAVVLLDAQTLAVIETVTTQAKAQFPYIPGLFSFRELPALIEAFALLKHTPDLVICDGQGIAHPRRFGLASHLGLLFDIPTIGCGKTRLLGEHDTVNITRGERSLLMDNNEVIGAALRTQTNIKPLYISIGHKISLESACEFLLKLTPKYRLPQTTRLADQAVNRARKAYLSQQGLNNTPL